MMLIALNHFFLGGWLFFIIFFFTIRTHTTMVRISALEGIFYKNFFFLVLLIIPLYFFFFCASATGSGYIYNDAY